MVSTSEPHWTPPCTGCVFIVRERACVPPPHEAVHDDHAENADTPQSTGHSCTLHTWVAKSDGHAWPPLTTAAITLRTLSCVPPPHDAEHDCHELQSDTWQSTEHGCALHARCSARSGHAAPPCCADVVIDRERPCQPPPHDFVHAVHAEKVDTTQCTGQEPKLQL